MRKGIQRETPQALRGRIPKAQSNPSMGHFVEDHGKEQNGNDDNNVDRVQDMLQAPTRLRTAAQQRRFDLWRVSIAPEGTG